MGTPFMDDPDATCLTVLLKPHVIGLSFISLAGFISTFAVLIFLGLVVRNFIRNMRDPPPGGEWRLIRTHVDAYLLSLLSSEILQGLGAIMDVKWVHQGAVYCSGFCTAQGAVQMIGETGVAMSTLAITLHTFFVTFFRWTPGPRSVWIYRTVIPLIWVYLTLFVVIAYFKHQGHNSTDPQVFFFSPTPYWCWIGDGFDAERIAGEYFWLWTAALSSIFFYTLLFFRLRGNIHVDPEDWKRIRIRLRPHSHFPFNAPAVLEAPSAAECCEAMAMIWYPICYTILVLPLSIVRWRTFRPPTHQELHTPFAVTAVVVTIFGLSGVVNVLLIMLTRRNLLLFGQRRGVVSTPESRNVNEGGFEHGSSLAVQSGMLSRGATRERVLATSVCSTTLPRTFLDRNGDLHDIKTIPLAGSNWENTSTCLAPSIGGRSVASMGDLREPMKFGATPPALLDAVYRTRRPLPDFALGKKTSELSIRTLGFPDEREWGRELNWSLTNIATGDSTSVGVEQQRSLESEDFGKTKSASLSALVIPPGGSSRAGEGLDPSAREQVRRTTNQSRGPHIQEERPRKLSHPLDPAPPFLLHRYATSSSQLRPVPPSVPPIPTGPPPRPSPLRGRGVPNYNAEGGVSFVTVRSVEAPPSNLPSLTESVSPRSG